MLFRLSLDRNNGVKKRVPIALSDVKQIQQSCYQIDDDLRWAVAMISDTGARLAEIIGASVCDLDLDSDKAPTLHIQPHSWRSLKTRSSNRKVPLVGAALWGARRAASNTQSTFPFPRYNKADLTNTNSASAALSKWIKAEGRSDYTMHSFRHSFRDRLRAVECPHDVIDQLGGWSRQSVGESYGQGYDMSILAKWMRQIEV
jgi:integrase